MTVHAHVRLTDIIDQIATIKPSSRNDFIAQIQTIAGSSLIRTIDTHNTESVLFVFQNTQTQPILHNRYILKAEYGNRTATEKEINWYLRVKENTFLPKQIFYSVSETHSLLVLEFIEDAQTLDNIDSQDGHASTLAYYRQAIEFDRKLYKDSMPRASTLKEMDKFYIDKFRQRLQESTRFDYLLRLLKKDTHIINGKLYYSPRHYIEKINENSTLRDHLMPRRLGLIHGDLHGGNILVANNHMYLVDPNGNREMPLEYDFGKILHTVHGRYPTIMNDAYVLDRDSQGFTFKLNTVQTEVYSDIKKLFDDSELVRGLYAEAMHFATMLPHHATNQRETTALFLRTIELFDDLYYIMNIK